MEMTDHKAWSGMLGALIATVVSRALVAYLPALTDADYPMLYDGISLLVGAVIGYAVTWWGPANKPKG